GKRGPDRPASATRRHRRASAARAPVAPRARAHSRAPPPCRSPQGRGQQVPARRSSRPDHRARALLRPRSMKDGSLPPPTPDPGHEYPELPERTSLPGYRESAAHCRACDLWKNATQTVFGEGKRTSKVVFVGEQPGDKEDIAGRPFVGPAGRVLDEALEAAGIDRSTVYVTNAVKHFKWRKAGKRRLHEKPGRSEIQA